MNIRECILNNYVIAIKKFFQINSFFFVNYVSGNCVDKKSVYNIATRKTIKETRYHLHQTKKINQYIENRLK